MGARGEAEGAEKFEMLSSQVLGWLCVVAGNRWSRAQKYERGTVVALASDRPHPSPPPPPPALPYCFNSPLTRFIFLLH